MRPTMAAAGGGANGAVARAPRLVAALCAFTMALAALAPAASAGAPTATSPSGSVIVRTIGPQAQAAVEAAVEGLGGEVGRRIGIIDAFVARVPSASQAALRALPGVLSVTPNEALRPQHVVNGFDAGTDAGSLYRVDNLIKARDLHKDKITAKGVDVALIDTGVVAVEGLSTPGKIVYGPDLSFESQSNDLRYLDTNGHGTHMAGIIAGKDASVVASNDYTDHDKFVGIAPDARVVSVKVANASGVTDVSQVLAAIDWVVQHRSDDGMNIRVLNLSYGTDGDQDYVLDPLTYAAEVAWRKGIVVVVAAGNSGYGSSRLNNPAYDPFVIAVGADDPKGTSDPRDDVVPVWSSRGNSVRHPDLVAPGRSVVSLRDPGSNVDLAHPEGLVNARFFRGSGTSQAAAAVSGAAALLLQARPGLTPDQVKGLLTSTAAPLPNADAVAQGAGLINVKEAAKAAAPLVPQTFVPATGVGSLEAARGSAHMTDLDGNVLQGESDIFGAPWDANTWSGSTWSGGQWNGNTWSGNTWSGNTWSGNTWSGNTWSGNTWSGSTWSGALWGDQ
jgi:subtilisin family serine protease